MYPDNYLNYENDDTVGFFTLPYEVFNNWSAHRVIIFGREFQTAEAAYQFAKFQTTAPDVAEQIAAAPSPWKVYRITDANRDKTDPTMSTTKAAIMEQIIRAKVEQNEDVRERLLHSGAKRIVENSPWDSFWGIGPDGTGKNTLGEIYMKIRNELIAKPK